MCRYTKSGFSKSSSTPQIGTLERVFSATPKSENQQPPPAEEDIVDDDLVSPFIYPSNLGYSRNSFEKKTEEEDADGSDSEKDQDEEDSDGSDSEKGQEEEADTNDIPMDHGNYNYRQGWNPQSGPFRRSPTYLPIHPSLSYGNDGCPVCSHSDCPGCKSCTGGSGICPGCGHYPG
ncbi:hypothetical protein HID58_045667 [Brassica napus]|uniref:Uncharacterized protein n=3 Tax=Brassica TaxID=3705 RepID=A0ABQ8AUC0_BRANA|nr:hypothetical protein HID58_045667 [Brassica napus]